MSKLIKIFRNFPVASGFVAQGVLLIGCATQPGLYSTANFEEASSRLVPKSLLELTDIKSFDIFVDAQTVHALVAGMPLKGEQMRVKYLRSDDGGLHWQTPISLDNQFLAPIATRGNDIQIAATGSKVVAVWQTKGEFPNQGPLISVFSNDGGLTWHQGSNPAARPAGDQAHADINADQKGNFHAVWLEDPEENGYQSLQYAHTIDRTEQWTLPQTLDDSTCSCCWNTLVSSASGTLNLLYRDMEPRDMALIRSADQGIHWSPKSVVGAFNWKFDGCPHIGGGLAVGGSNFSEFHSLVWTGAEGKQGLYYVHSEDLGQTWSPPRKMGGTALHGDIAIADSGSLAAVWDETGPEGAQIVFSRSIDKGKSWAGLQTLSESGHPATHPRIVATRKGFLAAWTEKISKNGAQLAMTFLE